MKLTRFLSLWMSALLVPCILLNSGIAAEPADEAPTGLEEETFSLEDPAVPPKEDHAPAPPRDSTVAPEDPAETIITEAEDPPRNAETRKKRSRQRSSTTIRGAGNERVEIGKNVVIRADEVVRELIVIAGNATVNGTVEGNLVVVSGSAVINGRVDRDLVTILGSVTLGPEGGVGNDVVVVGGPLNISDQATIGGHQTVVALGEIVPDFSWLQNWLSKGALLARPFPPDVKWVWIAAIMCLLLYLAVAVIFPRPVRACVRTIEHQPVASFFIGILLFVLLGPLLFLLVVSVAGLLVIPFLLCALVAAGVFGKIAVYSYAGQQVGRQIRDSDLSLPVVLILGATLFYLIYMVPVLGFAVWGIVTLLGIGAVLLAAFGPYRQEEQSLAYAGTPASGNPGQQVSPGFATTAGPAQLPPPILITADFAMLPRVGFWRRFMATLLDFVLLALLIQLTDTWFVLLWAAYHVCMWTWKGTTIGGIVMGIKIVRVDGEPINFAVALVRSLSSVFSAFALCVGFFWAGWDRERQAWHDKIAGTIIVKVPKGISLI